MRRLTEASQVSGQLPANLMAESFHHDVGVVAVDRIKPHAKRRLQLIVVLHVPAERDQPETVKKCSESTVPINPMQVDAVDAVMSE